MPLDKCTECIEIGFFGMHIRMYKMFTFFLFWLLNHLSNLHVLDLAIWCTSVTHFNNIFQQHNYVVHISLFNKSTPQKNDVLDLSELDIGLHITFYVPNTLP